jgi:hypothetical protein
MKYYKKFLWAYNCQSSLWMGLKKRLGLSYYSETQIYIVTQRVWEKLKLIL